MRHSEDCAGFVVNYVRAVGKRERKFRGLGIITAPERILHLHESFDVLVGGVLAVIKSFKLVREQVVDRELEHLREVCQRFDGRICGSAFYLAQHIPRNEIADHVRLCHFPREPCFLYSFSEFNRIQDTPLLSQCILQSLSAFFSGLRVYLFMIFTAVP